LVVAVTEKLKSGRFAYEGLDRIMHEKARLGILTSLLTHPEGLLFADLKQLCALTDGNLSRHLQALEQAGLVEVWKGFRNRKPQTLCRLSKEGRERFLEYLAELEQVLRDAVQQEETEEGSDRSDLTLPGDWIPA
jgi:DNA-binding MarR family transcriptional regulator